MNMIRAGLVSAVAALALSSCFRPLPPPPGPHRQVPRHYPQGDAQPWTPYPGDAAGHAYGPPRNAAPEQPFVPVPDGPAGVDPDPGPPVATRVAGNPNHVISPHEGNNVVDVSGFKSGELARDPTTGKIFRVP